MRDLLVTRIWPFVRLLGAVRTVVGAEEMVVQILALGTGLEGGHKDMLTLGTFEGLKEHMRIGLVETGELINLLERTVRLELGVVFQARANLLSFDFGAMHLFRL